MTCTLQAYANVQKCINQRGECKKKKKKKEQLIRNIAIHICCFRKSTTFGKERCRGQLVVNSGSLMKCMMGNVMHTNVEVGFMKR